LDPISPCEGLCRLVRRRRRNFFHLGLFKLRALLGQFQQLAIRPI